MTEHAQCEEIFYREVGGKLVTYRCTDRAGHDEQSHVCGTVTWVSIKVPPPSKEPS